MSEQTTGAGDARQERLARRFGAHAEVSRRTVTVPAAHGITQHVSTLVTTACGREVASTLVTRRADRVRCPDCLAVAGLLKGEADDA